MREIKFAWVCRNIQFNEIHRVELTDAMLLNGSYPSWITSDNCEVIARILPTGVLDMNGKEIYLGDSVKCKNRLSPDYTPEFEVTFLNGCFMFGTCTAHEFYRLFENPIVVGNKFENILTNSEIV